MKQGSITIDSLKIRIPWNRVKLIVPELADKWITATINTQTGEMVEDLNFKKNAYAVEEDGIKTKYVLEKQYNGRGAVIEYLAILFNSKLLKEAYFDGIAPKNIRSIYERLMYHGAVAFTYDDFLLGSCTDVDFKKDCTLGCVHGDEDAFLSVIDNLAAMSRSSTRKKHGYNAFKEKGKNEGIEWSDRNGATSANPFLKVYSKLIELKNNSDDFYKMHCKNVTDSVTRIEYTIKNKKHFRLYGVENPTLDNLLRLDNDQKEVMMKDVFNKHLEKKPLKKEVENIDDLKPMDRVILELLLLSIKSGHTLVEIERNCLASLPQRSRSQWKKKLENLYENYSGDSDEMKLNNLAVLEFFEMLDLV